MRLRGERGRLQAVRNAGGTPSSGRLLRGLPTPRSGSEVLAGFPGVGIEFDSTSQLAQGGLSDSTGRAGLRRMAGVGVAHALVRAEGPGGEDDGRSDLAIGVRSQIAREQAPARQSSTSRRVKFHIASKAKKIAANNTKSPKVSTIHSMSRSWEGNNGR